MQAYSKASYAGQLFRTKASQKKTKSDNSHLRYDYKTYVGERSKKTKMVKAFVQIISMFEHEMYPGGPTQVVVEGAWYKHIGLSKFGLDLVAPDPTNGIHTHSRFIFLTNCYQRPVALWPYDPFGKLPKDDLRKGSFAVIDRNQDEEF